MISRKSKVEGRKFRCTDVSAVVFFNKSSLFNTLYFLQLIKFHFSTLATGKGTGSHPIE